MSYARDDMGSACRKGTAKTGDSAGGGSGGGRGVAAAAAAAVVVTPANDHDGDGAAATRKLLAKVRGNVAMCVTSANAVGALRRRAALRRPAAREGRSPD